MWAGETDVSETAGPRDMPAGEASFALQKNAKPIRVRQSSTTNIVFIGDNAEIRTGLKLELSMTEVFEKSAKF